MAILNFSRIKQWLGLNNLTYSDLNAEFNNIFTGVSATNISGASNYPATLAGMQGTQNPGTVGSEVLPVSITDEVKELRYQLNAIIGGSFWYSGVPASLTTLNNSVNSLNPSPNNRIVSGRVTGFNQPDYLVPAGSSASVSLKATTTNLSTYINGAPVVFLADLTLAGLTVAPSTQNTCLVNDSTLAGTQSTKTQGERASVIQIDTIGTNISGKNGQYAAFKKGSEVFIGQVKIGGTTTAVTFTNAGPTVATIAAHGLNNGDQVVFAGGSLPTGVTAATLYFAQVIDTSTFYISATNGGALVATSTSGSGTTNILKNNCIRNCFRGWFFDSADAAIVRATLSDNDSITLLAASWIFATNNSSTPAIDVTYNKPTVSVITPSAPAIGDYWLDLNINQWKKYSGSSFVAVSAVFVGICVQDVSNTIAARSADFANSFSDLNTIEVEYTDSATVTATKLSDKISVYGHGFTFDYDVLSWNTANNLDTGVSLGASTSYYCYVSDIGKPFISDLAPTQRKFDLLGDYHPNKPWRCVTAFTTDGSSLVVASSIVFYDYHSRVLPNNFIAPQILSDRSISGAKLVNTPVLHKGVVVGGGSASGSGGATLGSVNSKLATVGGLAIVTSNDALPAGANAFSVIRGYVAIGATVNSGEGFGVSRPSTGNYTITFTTPFLDTPAVVFTTVVNIAGGAEITGLSNSSVSVAFLNHAAGSVATNTAFTFVAIGQVG